MGCVQSKIKIDGGVDKKDNDSDHDAANSLLNIESWRDYPEQALVNDRSVDRRERAYWKSLLAWAPPALAKKESKEEDAAHTVTLEDSYELLAKRIIRGEIEAALPPEKNSIRIFLSSTFNDYGAERDLLLRDVLPFLKFFGSKFGIDVVISEMRWGISDESVKENRTIELCMNEIEHCRNVSVGPFFCLMLGNRYGYRPPPPMLSVSEYNDALQRAKDEENEQVLLALQSVYRLDNNLRPPSYVLLTQSVDNTSHKESIGNTITKLIRYGKGESNSYKPPSNDTQLHQELLTDFFDPPSVTEREAMNGFLSSNHQDTDKHELAKKVGIFHRNIEKYDGPHSSKYHDEFEEQLDDLKFRTKKFAVDGAFFREYQVASPVDEDVESYLLEFSNDFCQWIVKSIIDIATKRAELSEGGGQSTSLLLLREISIHHAHAQRICVGREGIVRHLVQHCKTGKGCIVLRGSSGTGKTTLLAQIAQRISMSSDMSTAILVRFLGTTPASSTSEAVTASMFMQLSMAFPDIASNALSKEDAAGMRPPARFLELVRAISSRDKRIVMIIDSLDQLDSSDPGRDAYESWLPTLFGAGVLPNVAILLSALPGHLDTIEAMPLHRIEDLPQFSLEEGEEMLDHLCQRYARGLEQKQRNEILEKFCHERSTLFLNIAFLQSLRWRSWDTNIKIPITVNKQIRLLFSQLSKDFGPQLVQAFISCLISTPGGMNLDEIREVVSMDNRVLSEAFVWHKTPDDMVPSMLIYKIVGGLEHYLVTRKVDELDTKFWYHRKFWEASVKEYLSATNSITKIHKQAIDYYAKQPTYVSPMKINTRKMRQLPHRLREIKDWPGLCEFLSNTPEALIIELESEEGRSKYASYWRSLNDATSGNTNISVETALQNFTLRDSGVITDDHIFLIADFLKEYFNAYEVSLKVFMVALKIDISDRDIFEEKYRISESRQLDCMSRIGDVYTRLSKYDEAHKWLFKSYSELKRNMGEDHSSTLCVLSLLSRLMKDWGKYKESLEYDTKLYDLSLKKFGEHHEKVADAARQLARTHYLSGRYPIAIGYYSKNLTIRKLLFGDQHPQSAVALNCVGMANKVIGKYEEGLKYCRQAYDVKVELYGKEHSDTAVTIDNLGSLYHLDGRFDEAMKCYKEAWKIKRSTLGADHADTIMMFGQIGRLYHDKGELDKALPLLRRNLSERTRILDPRHPQIAVAKTPLAALLINLKEFEEAFVLAKEAVELRLDVLGPHHPYTAFSYDTLALAELGRGNINEAEKAAIMSYDIRRDVVGPSHPRCAVAHMTLSKVRSAQGRHGEALVEAKKADEVHGMSLREGHPFQQVSNDLVHKIGLKTGKGEVDQEE